MRSGGWNGISALISVTEELTFFFFLLYAKQQVLHGI